MENQLPNLEEELSPEELRWEKMFSELAEFKEKHGHALGPLNPQENIFLWKWVDEQRKNEHSLSLERIKRLKDLGFQWAKYDIKWETNFLKLIEFKNKFGHTNVPPSYEEDRSLGKWVSKVRSRRSGLKSYRLNRLKEIGFYWNPFDKQWNEGFSKLLEFKKMYNHCNVPENFKDDPKLARWVARQRAKRKKLENEKFEKLISIGFEFTPKADTWEKMFNELLAFKEKHGQCYRDFKNEKLNFWVQLQRKNKNRLSFEKVRQLEKIGFVWEVREFDWDTNFSKLEKFKEKYGHCNVPARYEQDLQLAWWVSTQKRNRESISLDRKKKLEDLGFIWSSRTLKRAA